MSDDKAFSTDLNYDIHKDVQDTKILTAGDVMGGSIATITDIGASLWNSLPFTPEVETKDLLQRIGSGDALRVYEEHPDAVHAASFIGGMFVPMGLATKTLNLARNGVKGAHWFNAAGKEADMAKAAKLFEDAGEGTKEYRSLVRGIYAKSAVNASIDIMAQEVALVGLMHAHPFMEDYTKDPVKNFALSMAFGGALGGTAGLIADRFALRGVTGKVFAEAFTDVKDVQRSLNPTMTNAVQMQSHEMNINSLDWMMASRAEKGLSESNDLRYAMAKTLKQDIVVQQDALFKNMVSPEILAFDVEQRNVIKKLIVEKPEMFGVENVKLLTAKDIEGTGVIKAPTFAPTENPSLFATGSKAGPIQPTAKEAVYFPELGLYGVKSDAVHYAGAATLGKDAEGLVKQFAGTYNYGKIANIDSDLALLGKSSADIQGEYIAAMTKVKGMSVKELESLNLSVNDGPLLHAVLLKMSTDPLAAGAKVRIADRAALNKAILDERTAAMGGGKLQGPTASYSVEMEKLGEGIHAHQYDPNSVKRGIQGAATGKLSDGAYSLLTDWIGGSQATLRKAYVDWQTSRFSGFKGGINPTKANEFEEIYNSSGSRQLRSDFLKIADEEGNIYLYRGLKRDKISGSQPLESYTTHISKAEQFGNAKDAKAATTGGGVKLFKVHVDDIVAGFQDVGGGVNNAEVIVRSAARPIEAELTAQGKLAFKGTQAASAGAAADTSALAGVEELSHLLVSQKQEAIDTLIANGIPFESIALKTNTRLDIVQAYAMVKQSSTMGELRNVLDPNASALTLGKIQGYDDIEKALAKANQPLVLAGNMRKAPYTEAHAGLNNAQLNSMNKEIMSATMFASPSSLVKAMAEFLHGEEGIGHAVDIIKTKLGMVNNQLAGSAMFNSLDHWARRMEDIGPVASYMGKKFQEIGNDLVNKITKPLEGMMGAIAKDPVALIEYNTAMNKNAELAGWRAWTSEGKLVQKVDATDEAGKRISVLKPVAIDSVEYQIKTPSVLELVLKQQSSSKELRDLRNTINQIQGKPNVSDIGFWVPSFNPVNKFIAYAHDTQTDITKMIWGRTESEYKEAVKAYKTHLNTTGQQHIEVYEKGEQEFWNVLNGRLDNIHMERADIELLKKGSTAGSIVKSDANILSEMAGGYQHYVSSQVRTLADLNLSEITGTLAQLSSINKASTKNQPFDKIKSIVTQPKDAAATMRNAILGNSNLGEYTGWQSANRTFETYLTIASNSIGGAVGGALKFIPKDMLSGEKPLSDVVRKKIDYEQIQAELTKRGIHNPYAQFDEAAAQMFGLSKLEDHKDTAKRVITASNALAATAALRFGELAQPLVNAVSMPILAGLAMADKMPATFLGAIKGNASVMPMQIMYEGIRAMHSPLFEKFNKAAEKAGYFSPMVSEVTNVLRASRTFEKGAVAGIENALDHNFVKVMSKPSDFTESLTRKASMNMGAVLAKRLYPELDDAGVMIFARDFMDKSLGNFHASQRPVFFQGTLGNALGLFQTYSLTLAQSVYRNLELKNYKALGKAALTQSTLFGTKTLPGFEQVSNAIGEHFSDDNYDLVTGTYRAVPSAADFILYGLPSNLGPSISSRGDTNPRLPLVNGLVAYNFLKETGTMMGHVKDSLDADQPAMGRALAQSLSLQSMSRPLARTAELVTGYSITGKGNTVQTPAEVWTPTGIMARALATRPIQEQKLRDADHMNRFYGAADKDNREKAMATLKTSVRNGTLTDERVAKTAEEYMRHGGSPRGWQTVLNTAIARADTAGSETFLHKLKPNNPLNHMIDNLD